MVATNFSLFLSISLVVSASPGPVMLSCMANGGRLGLAKAWVGMLGASCGNLCLVLLCASGLGLVISRNETLFNSVRWMGAGYLVWLGIELIRTSAALRHSSTSEQQTATQRLWWNAFIIAISNPKGFIYFGAVFPQFIAYNQALAPQFLGLTLTFLAVDLFWMFIYASAGKHIMRWLKTANHQAWFNRISGFVLIAAGMFMALSGTLL